MLLLDAFRVHALHNPGNVAVVKPRSGEEFVYRQIWNASELLGAHLIEQTAEGRLAVGEPVAIVGGAQPLALACIIACAKSSHPHFFVEDMRFAAPLRVVLTANKATAALAKQYLGVETLVFDAELMLSYIVPGMTDDFSCGCGTEDCAHGPFLQECMPSEWFGVDGVFFVGDGANNSGGGSDIFGDGDTPSATTFKSVVGMTVAAHDEMLTAALMAGSGFAADADKVIGGGSMGEDDTAPDDTADDNDDASSDGAVDVDDFVADSAVVGEHSVTLASAVDERFAGAALGGDGGSGGCDRSPDDLNRTSSTSKKSLPLNLCNSHLAVALATGATITLK